ncbi:restriction endonuclease subunit S [Vibrio parahaemolyticus]|uniref:restriction endonuclease subunit S n=1 Tax=Vibrio parahaemolyticus TaxID=670 RepID=UPI0015DF6037|nr:restriction endonuclease subunit S [Vibrio parahaemolyticus]MBE4331719.1 restriction endonuclease subunit S [Vibrio parahaemolyticus]MBE4345135.1 restriction endonuclease subunit S [Vibrio parahaemolyticus]MDF4911644.1 restriction endonuclease subunit S [Vibrio parahaemolyticus]HCG5495066.1 restriction endonuclease subunit S [Vibrio parahaemolyticus]
MSFNKVKLADICTAITYGYTASAKSEPDNAKFLRITDIQGGVVDWDSVPYCEITPDHVAKYRLSHGDIVVARTGNSTGENYLFESDEVAVYASYLIKYSVNKDIADPFFVWLQMRTPKWWSFINGAKGGSAQAGANAKVIGDFDVALPPLSIQKQIVSLVKPYYDKIANNKAMNQTLEKLAQRIFKSWFIDFDPVKANKEGLPFDGLSPEIQALFPSEFEDSELGMIPKGWSVDQINKLSQVAIGKTPPRKQSQWFEDKSNENNTKWFSIKDMGSNGMYALNSSECLTNEAIDKFNVKVVPENTVILSFKLTLGRLSITTEECATNEAIAHFKLDEKHNKLSSSFIYFYLKNFNFNLLGSTSSIATAINSKMVKEIPVLYSDNAVMSQFSKTLDPLMSRVKLNAIQNDKLERIRDRLLPKLISGQISAGEVAQELPEAV